MANLYLLCLPGGLGHAGDQALVGQLPEADAADAELTHISMRPSAELAAIVSADRKLRGPLGFLDQAFFCQRFFLLEYAQGAETGNSIPEIRTK